MKKNIIYPQYIPDTVVNKKTVNDTILLPDTEKIIKKIILTTKDTDTLVQKNSFIPQDTYKIIKKVKQKDTIKLSGKKVKKQKIIEEKKDITLYPGPGVNREKFLQNFLYNIKWVEQKKKERACQEIIHKETKKEEIKIKPRTYQYPADWFIGIIIGSLIILAYVRIFYRKYMNRIFKATYNYREQGKLFKNINLIIIRANFLLNIVFVINISLFIYQLIKFFDIKIDKISNINEYLTYFLIITGIYTLKYIGNKILGLVLEIKNLISEYLHSVYMYIKIYGLILYPIVICIGFAPAWISTQLIYTGIVLFGLMYIMRILRGLHIIIINKISLFYTFLYLCILEIMPLYILYRFIKALI